MDLNSKTNASEKTQSKTSSGTNSHSSRSQQSNRNARQSDSNSRNRNHKSNKSGHQSKSNERRYQQRSGYQNNNRNHQKNYNPNWHWENTRSNRKDRWNASGPKFGNLTWQRSNLSPPQEYWSRDPQFSEDWGHFRNFPNNREYSDQNTRLVPGNQIPDRSLDESERCPDQNFFRQSRVHTENRNFFDRSQGPRERRFNKNFKAEGTIETQTNSGNRDRRQGIVDLIEDQRDLRVDSSKNRKDQDFVHNCESRAKLRNDYLREAETLNQKILPNQGALLNEPSKERNDISTQVFPETENRNLIQEEPKLDENSEPRNDSLRLQNQNQNLLQDSGEEHSELNNIISRQGLLESFNQQPAFIKSEPLLSDSPEHFLLNIKTELPDATDSDFELRNCLNVDIDNQFPSISVIPISRLIKSELEDLSRADIIAPTTPARGRPTLRPNLVQRRKKSINDDSSGTLSENLVQRVANMDKVGIKNVINNSGTKYDAALKIQARKKLREEIRKQLKSMNFTPPVNSENNVLVPDEIVDSMNIPAVILDEIRKAFGIVLVEDMKVIPESEKTNEQLPPAIVDVAQPKKSASNSPDLMSRLKMLEEIKSQTSQSEKLSPVKSPLTPKKHRKTSQDVVIINSSSSSSSSSSSDSDSDSSSTTTDSDTSKTSSYKRRRRKKRILEANVVGNFEKLILPNLTIAQRRRYREKYSTTTKSSLLYIYGICVSRANLNSSTLESKEKLKLKHNLNSADNAQALEFLMKAILNLFEQQKEKRRKNKEQSTPSATSPSKPGSRSKRLNPVSPTKKLKDSTCNQENSDNEQGREQTSSASTAGNAELPKHQSTKVDNTPPPPPEGGVNRNAGDSIAESANSAQGVFDDGRLVAQVSDSDSDLDDSIGNKNPPSRLWKSPGEKKCIEIETPSPLSGLGMMQPPMGIHSLDLDSLKSQSSIGDEAVTSIREIDVKLMELHKRKMYIEEMILKLQKDKMEVDLWTMKLQNEKFILLNSALASASSSCMTMATPTKEKKPKPAIKRKPFSTPFSEKLRNRKKRCQRDILLEEAGKAFDTKNSETSPSSAGISQLMLQPRKTRGALRSSKVEMTATETEKTSITETTKTDTAKQAAEGEMEKEKEDIIDYTDVPNGNLEGWKLPITQIIVVGEAIVAASEDGNIYKFNIRTRELESKFSKHTEAITQIFSCPNENFVYTTSLDGFLKKTSIENFGLEIQSLNLQEPLQSIDIEWATAYIGSRWGNIFTYDIKNNNLSESLLCSSGSSIIALKATKEGPRKILIVSSKGNQISFRDAMTGLLLRSLDVPDNLHIYSILLDNGCIFCGTQRNEIHQYNFTTGGRLAIFQCGNGAVSMKLYKDKFIFVGCYDGFVYVLDKTTGCQIGRFPGSGKMILALEIAGDKIITSAKDNTMHIIDIPKYIITKDKS